MYKLLRNKRLVLGSFFPVLNSDGDIEKYNVARGFYINDPWLRVKSIFSKDEYGAFHPELVCVIGNSQVGGCLGAFYGAIIESKKEVDKFIRTNDTNIYINKKEVFKVLNNKNLIGMLRGIIKWAPRFALFSGSFTLLSSCCELYRNSVSIIDNMVGGFIVGALCRFSFGIKGMLSGGIVGGVLGTLYGTVLLCLCNVMDVDRIQIKYAQFAFLQHREQQKNKAKTEKNKVFESLEKSGMYVSHIPDPLTALNDEEKELEDDKEIKPN